MHVTSPEAYQLLHEGIQALSEVENAGMCLDAEYLKKASKEVGNRIQELEAELIKTELWKDFRRTFGDKANLRSGQQLKRILGTKDATAPTLKALDREDVSKWLDKEQQHKMRKTYLGGLRNNMQLADDGNHYVHASFGLSLARTYRGECHDPNLQNIPIRDPKLGKLIREAFIPRSERRRIVEIDFSAIEVRIAACYHKDPVMLEYINDKSKDMHRDMAAQCFKVPPNKVSKEMRYAGKNMFVFPQFYGSVAFQCAPNLWEAIGTFDMEVDGVPLKKHLAKNGVKGLGLNPDSMSSGKIEYKEGSFAAHIRDVEEDFWKRRFKKYDKWKRDWYQSYLNTGGFRTLTGFYISGEMKRNDVINYPIQGPAFHCMLWSIIKLNKWLKKHKFKSKIICYIHDSLLADVCENEYEDFIEIAHQILTKELVKNWKWIIVPIEVEVEAAPLGASWFHKKKVDLAL